MEATAQEKAEAAALEAQRLASVAAEAALIQKLESVRTLKDFDRLTENNAFDSAKLKSSFISRFGFKNFETLCGRSH